MFSARTAWDRNDNRITRAIHEVRASSAPFFDLTESNPTRAGLSPQAPTIALLGHPRGAEYDPLATGHPRAREAAAHYYAERGHVVDPAQIVLSASTSEAYGWLFKLLCDPGDNVLVPRPSYPLFSWLASLENVRLVPYRMPPETGHRFDFDELRSLIDERTRAVLVVHPNNPTGAFTRESDLSQLDSLACERGLALVSDEVFADYAFEPLPSDRARTFIGERRALTFVLSGLSKVALLPQLKLAWTVVQGPAALQYESLARLELIADTYLSVGTPVQLALSELLAHAKSALEATRNRTLKNLQALDSLLADRGSSCFVRRLPVDGGWYATLEIPRLFDDDTWVEKLVRDERVLVQPGYYFDYERDGLLVVSLLTEPALFLEGITRVVARIDRESRGNS